MLIKEWTELTLGWRGPLLVFVLPVAVVLLVGQLQTRTPVLRTLVVGDAKQEDLQQWRERTLLVRLLVEAAAFDVATRETTVADPLAELRAGDYDLLIAAEDDAAGEWRIFTAETDPRRLAAIEGAMAGLERALPAVLAQAREQEQGDDAVVGSDERGAELVRQLGALAMLSTGHRFLFYPAAADRGHAALPMTIGLIACFLPFVVAAPGLVRERNARTLEVILAAPGVGPGANFAGRSCAAVLVTVVAFLAMVVAAWVAYGLRPKAGLIGVVLVLSVALFASTFLGMAASSVARSQSQATAASAAWFLWLLLASGVLIPLEQSSPTLAVLSLLSPLTAVHELLNAWMFGAPWSDHAAGALAPLILQFALFGLVAWLAYTRMLRRL